MAAAAKLPYMEPLRTGYLLPLPFPLLLKPVVLGTLSGLVGWVRLGLTPQPLPAA